MTDFVTWLAGRDESQLAEILRHRPEALSGSSPSDLAAVASRLSQHHGIGSALLDLPRPALQVLTAVLVLGGRVSVAQCAQVLEDGHGNGDHLGRVRDRLRQLERRGLVWIGADDVANAAPVVSAVLAVPADWGQPARGFLEALSKEALTPTLMAWGLPRQSTKAATVAVLADAFGDPIRLANQLERLTPRQRELLAEGDRFDLAPADQRWFRERAEASRAGVAAGVLFAAYAYQPFSGEAPVEVRIALRSMLLPFDPLAPSLPSTDIGADPVALESRAALEQFNEAALSVLDHLRGQPIKRLQNGGVGAREITRVAKASKVDASLVRLVLDLALAAGLVDTNGRVLAWGDVTGAWRDLDAGSRVTLLLESWMELPWSPTQSHDAAGTSLSVGDWARRCLLCRDGRITTLREWARQDGGVSNTAMAAQVAWTRPLTHTAHREVVEEPDSWDYRWPGRRTFPRTDSIPPLVMNDDPDLGTIADEARLLGLVAYGAGTPLLRALLAGSRPELVALAGAMLPTATSTATFGSDLTAVVVGPPTGELSALLDSCADRESRGGAVIWRFSTASVRRALDGGVAAAELVDRLTDVAAGDLPQPLGYLLADVGRRHGALRVAPARAVIRSEDQALLAEVTVDRKLRRLALRLVAPTIAVSAVGAEETINGLRAAGYLPMPEARDASENPEEPVGLALRRPAQVEATADEWVEVMPHVPPDFETPRRLGGAARTGPDPAPIEDAESAAARLVGVVHAPGATTHAPRLADAIRRINRRLSEDEILTLAEAIHRDHAVRIRYRSASSSVTERVVSELELAGGLLEGWCHLRDAERVFRVSEILSVAHP